MIAYLDLPSGISGDMFLGCLVDAGWPREALIAVAESLHLPPDTWAIETEQVMRGPLVATLVTVRAQEGDKHRHLSDVTEIIRAADLPPSVQERAVAVFTRLAQAEAAVHGVTVEQIHFHEVGAIDAIIDIVGVCAGLHALGIDTLHASALPLGEGWANTAHGRIPLPAPATLALLSDVGAPTRPAPGPGELVTPTGAALVAELARFGQPPMRLQHIGQGAGRKEFDWPNIARLWLGERETPAISASASSAASPDGTPTHLVQLETNIDDMNPELYPEISRRLFASGAVDAWITPIQMKKGRPGVLLAALAPAHLETEIANLLLAETTTLGVRVHPVHRHIAAREFTRVATEYGPVPVKLKRLAGELVGAKPEYDACQQLAQTAGVPVRLVYEAALAAAHSRNNGNETAAGGSWE